MSTRTRSVGVLVATVLVTAVLTSGCSHGADHPWAAGPERAAAAPVSAGSHRVPLALPVPPVAAALPTLAPADVPKDLPAADVDTSFGAQENFFVWEDYELPSPDLSRGPEADFAAGTTTCVQRSQGQLPTQVVSYLVAESGYHGAAAEAIVAAALRAICLDADTGYRTAFDKNVDQFEGAVLTHVSFTPSVPAFPIFGFFLKETCAAMTAPGIGGPGIYEHMVALTDNGTLTLAHGGDTNVVNILINEAVWAGCPWVYDFLPPIIQASS